ncbi:MAG: four helix bundle protein [bacterium]|nr:four helix bundle protein [bacterium]
MPPITCFEDIQAWQLARKLVVEVYKLTDSGLVSRDFEFQRQIRGAALSVMSDIAAGFGRRGDKEFARMLDLAVGSAAEVQSLLYVAGDLGYCSEATKDVLQNRFIECSSMIQELARFLRQPKGSLT